MFNALTGLAMGIVVFAVTVGVGVVVLGKFGASVAECSTGYTYNVTSETCWNGTDSHATSPATTTTNALNTELGTSGLAGWTAAIIALAVGLLFIGALMGRGKRNY